MFHVEIASSDLFGIPEWGRRVSGSAPQMSPKTVYSVTVSVRSLREFLSD